MKPLLTALLLVLLGAPAAFAADLGYPLDAPAMTLAQIGRAHV